MQRPNRSARYYATSTDEESRLALLAILKATWDDFTTEEHPDPYYDLSRQFNALEMDKVMLSDAIVSMLPSTMQNEINLLKRSYATILDDRDEHKKMVDDAKKLIGMPKDEAIMVTNGGDYDYTIESVAAHFGEVYNFMNRKNGSNYLFYDTIFPQVL